MENAKNNWDNVKKWYEENQLILANNWKIDNNITVKIYNYGTFIEIEVRDLVKKYTLNLKHNKFKNMTLKNFKKYIIDSEIKEFYKRKKEYIKHEIRRHYNYTVSNLYTNNTKLTKNEFRYFNNYIKFLEYSFQNKLTNSK